LGKVEKRSANAMEVEKRTAGKTGLNATVLAFQTGETVTVGKTRDACSLPGKVEKGWNGGEVGEKCVAGISGLNATVLAIQTGKMMVLLELWGDKCPRGKNPQNEGAHGRAYVMRNEEPQQDLNE
nr:hypothetical protein [Tanacetum cinerariifolium]GEZ99119.1 hypothetical protein [Tanacetum cinerariifolium]